MSSESNTSHDLHPWAALSSRQVLEKLLSEIYAPVSALGGGVDRLANSALEGEDSQELVAQIRENVNALSRLVVNLKRYTAEHKPD